MGDFKLFDPDVIATDIASAVKLDFLQSHFESGYGESITNVFRHETMARTLLKKYDPQNQDSSKLQLEAFARFRKTLQSCEQSYPCGETSFRLGERVFLFSQLTQLMKGYISWILGAFDTEEWLHDCRHSPGVTVGVKYADCSSSRKWQAPISGTGIALDYIQHLVFPFDSRLREACLLTAAGEPGFQAWRDVVTSSRATTVPKDESRRRMIAVEPTANMYLQQGLMEVMYRRLKSFGYDISVLPQVHQDLARRGSVSQKCATIDFSNASDTVSLSLVREVFPKEWLRVMEACRCPSMNIDGEMLCLPVYATMGNATTFPVETLVFLSLALSVYQLKYQVETPGWPARVIPDLTVLGAAFQQRFSVFGDDCILPRAIAHDFCELSDLLGFSVNADKSYLDGPFRESCGGDYYRGTDVRGVYLRAPTSTKAQALEPWLYTMMNSLIPKYILHFGELTYVYNQAAFRLFAKLFRQYNLRIKVVPSDYPDDAGLKTEDWRRVLRNYQIPMCPLLVGRESVSFRYCTWRYRETLPVNPNVAYAEALRRLAKTSTKPVSLTKHLESKVRVVRWWEKPNRKVGSYVVAPGLTSFWTP